MTKEEKKRTWEPWVLRRRLMYFLARRFPKFLSSFYRRSFLSGKHDRIDKWLSLSLGKKDEILIEDPKVEEHLQRDIEESIRQGSIKPFMEEAVLQGRDDMVVPPSVTDYIARILPGSYVHKLPNEGHFSYLYFCDECHRQIFTTPFGSPQGPVVEKLGIDTTSLEGNSEEISTNA
ncbi:hypothetical protein TB2_009336 [Malus domestica]